MRQVDRKTDLNYTRAHRSGSQYPVDHFAPEAVPHLAEAYFEARDRRRARAHSPGRGTKLLRRFVIVCFAIGAGILTFAYLTDGASRVATPKALHGDIEKLAIAAGFGINQVALTGHRFTLEDDVFDALDLANMRSFLSFEPKLLSERLQRLPWIKTVEAARIYPGQLQIRVSEREPAAVWQRGGQDYLIDLGGRTLTAVAPGALDHLPRVRGEGAAAMVDQLFALLQRFPDIAAFVTVSERVGERRWTLKLVGGGALLLPAGQETRALEAFLSYPRALALVEAGDSMIDLRADGRIAVRPIAPDMRMTARGRDIG